MDRRIRWVILGFCCALFLVLAPGLVLYALGYRLRGGQWEQTGLLVLKSQPAGAEVWIDGKPTDKKTPADMALRSPGSYAVTLRLAGHHDWNKRFELQPQKVRRAEEILLLPEHIEPFAAGTQTVSAFSLTQDGKLLVFADTQSPPSVWTRPPRLDEPATLVLSSIGSELPQDAVIKKIDLPPAGRAALLTVECLTQADPLRTYWLSLREPYLLVRVDLFFPSLTMCRINPRAPQQVLVLTSGRLCRLDAQEKNIRWDIAQNVETFEVTEDGVWFLKNNNPSVWFRPLNSDNPVDEKEVFVCAPSNPRPAPRRLVAGANRNVAVLFEGGGALLRRAADSKELTDSFAGAQTVAFSPDHLRVAIADDKHIVVKAANPIDGVLSDPLEETGTEEVFRSGEGQSIEQFIWWPDAAHLLVRSGGRVELVETATAGGQNRIPIVTLSSAQAHIVFNTRESILFFTDSKPIASGSLTLFGVKLVTANHGWLDWFSKPKPTESSTETKP